MSRKFDSGKCIPFFGPNFGETLPVVTKERTNATTDKLNFLTELVETFEDRGAEGSADLLEMRRALKGNDPKSSLPRYDMLDEILQNCETWHSFEEKLQAHVAPKVSQTMLEFNASSHFMQRVNPLWFTKFPKQRKQ